MGGSSGCHCWGRKYAHDASAKSDGCHFRLDLILD